MSLYRTRMLLLLAVSCALLFCGCAENSVVDLRDGDGAESPEATDGDSEDSPEIDVSEESEDEDDSDQEEDELEAEAEEDYHRAGPPFDYAPQSFTFLQGPQASPVERRLYEYDETGRLIVYSTEKHIENDWLPESREEYSYDPDGSLRQAYLEHFEENWFAVSRSLYSYDDQGRLAIDTASLADEDGSFEFWKRTSYGYDEHGRLVSLETERYEQEAWDLRDGHIFVYDDAGRLLSDTYRENMQGLWLAKSRRVMEYDGDFCVHAIVVEIFVDDEWLKSNRTVYVYDEPCRLSEAAYEQSLLGVSWTAVQKTVPVFAQDGRLQRLEDWRLDGEGWRLDGFGDLLHCEDGSSDFWEREALPLQDYIYRMYGRGEINRYLED